jgi:hypothetical protein
MHQPTQPQPHPLPALEQRPGAGCSSPSEQMLELELGQQLQQGGQQQGGQQQQQGDRRAPRSRPLEAAPPLGPGSQLEQMDADTDAADTDWAYAEMQGRQLKQRRLDE